MRDPETLVRYFAVPGMQGFGHRNMGLERDARSGTISTDPANHALMVETRARKVQNIARSLPLLQVYGDSQADTLFVGFGSTEGHLRAAVDTLLSQGKPCALAHFNYICPLPLNTAEVLRKYRRIIVCELNSGQFATYLRSQIEGLHILQYNKLEAQPFLVTELVEAYCRYTASETHATKA